MSKSFRKPRHATLAELLRRAMESAVRRRNRLFHADQLSDYIRKDIGLPPLR